MFDCIDRPTINDVRNALKPLAAIPRPDGDNDGNPINSPSVFEKLPKKHQDMVNYAVEIVYEYTRTVENQENQRAVTIMNKNGFATNLGPSQDDPDRIVGVVQTDKWTLDISDACNEAYE